MMVGLFSFFFMVVHEVMFLAAGDGNGCGSG